MAQEHPNWVNYTSTRSVKKVIQDKNTLWIVTKGGLIKHNLITRNDQYFNRDKSVDLKTTNKFSEPKDKTSPYPFSHLTTVKMVKTFGNLPFDSYHC